MAQTWIWMNEHLEIIEWDSSLHCVDAAPNLTCTCGYHMVNESWNHKSSHHSLCDFSRSRQQHGTRRWDKEKQNTQTNKSYRHGQLTTNKGTYLQNQSGVVLLPKRSCKQKWALLNLAWVQRYPSMSGNSSVNSQQPSKQCLALQFLFSIFPDTFHNGHIDMWWYMHFLVNVDIA